MVYSLQVMHSGYNSPVSIFGLGHCDHDSSWVAHITNYDSGNYNQFHLVLLCATVTSTL